MSNSDSFNAKEDSFNDAYLSTSNKVSPNRAELLAQLDKLTQEEEQDNPAAASPSSLEQPASGATLSSTEAHRGSPSVLTEARRAAAGGVRDAAQNALNLIDDAATWLNNNVLDLRIGSETFGKPAKGAARTGEDFVTLPEVSKNETTAGNVARTVTQFVVPFIGATKLLKAGSVFTKSSAARSAAAGAATDFTAFDPNEKRLSNLILDSFDSVPAVARPVLEYLSANEGDSALEGRFKNMLEGLGLGLAVDGVIKGAKAVRGYYAAKGQNAGEVLGKALDERQAAKEADSKLTPAEQKVKADEAAANRSAAESIEAQRPEAVSLARQEVANIAPRQAGSKASPVIAEEKVKSLVEAVRTNQGKTITEATQGIDFNFSHIDTPEDVKETINTFSTVFEKEHTAAKGGTQSFEQIVDLAEELGAKPESLTELYKGTSNLGARVLAHRTLVAASAGKVTSLAKLATGGDADAILALRKQVTLHASIQAEMKGVQTEVARALSQFRISTSSVDLAVQERDALIAAMGGHAANARFAQQLAAITDPKKLNAVLRKSALARTQDALFEAWVNGLLTSPVTHAVNATSNTLVALGSLAERGTAAMIGKVLRTGPDAVQASEVKALAFGMTEGLMDAIRITRQGMDAVARAGREALTGDLDTAGRIIRDNQDQFGSMWHSAAKDQPILDTVATKMDTLSPAHALSADALGVGQKSILGYVANSLGTLVRAGGGRALTTADELFKTIHYRGNLKAQAYRLARQSGKDGEEFIAEVARLIEDPTPEMRAQALVAAREGTFTSPLGQAGILGQGFVQRTPGLRYIVPFIRTPVNIVKYVGERTPVLNLMAESVRAEFHAGGARRDLMLAKTAIGGALYALGAHLAAQGVIVGGGEKQQQAERLGGQQSYSVKVGDKYYSFNRLDPIGMFLGLSADIADIAGHADEQTMAQLVGAAALALNRNLVSKSYLNGIVTAVDTFSDSSPRSMERFLEKFAGSFVPSGVNAMRKEVDPVVREVWGLVDAVKNRIPGFSSTLPPSRNLFGEPVMHKGGLGLDIASPVMTSEESSEPAAREIARLNVDLRHPLRTIGSGGGNPGVDLSPQEYDRLMQIQGPMFKEAVTKLVTSPMWERLPEGEPDSLYTSSKEKAIRLVYTEIKQAALGKLLLENEGLRKRFMANERNKANALTGQPITALPGTPEFGQE